MRKRVMPSGRFAKERPIDVIIFIPSTFQQRLRCAIAKAAEYSLCSELGRVFAVNPVEPCIEDCKGDKGKYHEAEGRIPRRIALVVHWYGAVRWKKEAGGCQAKAVHALLNFTKCPP